MEEKEKKDAVPADESKKKKKNKILVRIWNDRTLYIMFLPVFVWYIVFAYLPMYGIILSFKDYSIKKGILGSPWVGLQNFKTLFADPYVLRALLNTVILGVGGLAISMPLTILLALMINEIRLKKSKKVLQTVITFPHFVSWVIISGMLINLFASDGVFFKLFSMLGLKYVNPVTNPNAYRWFVWFSDLWKEIGWGTIIYLAAIANVDQAMYESALIDGATRLRMMWSITIPSIRPTISILLIMGIGGVVTNGRFDQIFNTYSAQVYSVADTFDTYIFRETLQMGSLDFGYSTAIGLVRSLAGVIMLLAANKIVTSMGESGMF